MTNLLASIANTSANIDDHTIEDTGPMPACPRSICYTCKRHRWYLQPSSGMWVCGTCHPPPQTSNSDPCKLSKPENEATSGARNGLRQPGGMIAYPGNADVSTTRGVLGGRIPPAERAA